MTVKTLKLQVGKETLVVEQAHLKTWLLSSEIYSRFRKALTDKSFTIVPMLVTEYLTLTTGLDRNFWDKQSWLDTVSALDQIVMLNVPTISASILSSKDEAKEQPWDYPQRLWYLWANAFAHAYGWELYEIEHLSIDDAIGLFQEIEFDQQMEKEFYYGLSEVAYPYNKSTKKSIFKPMPRPDWMLPASKGIPKVMLDKSMLPMGQVEDISKMFEGMVINQ